MSQAEEFVLVTRRGKRRSDKKNLNRNTNTPSVSVEENHEVDNELLLRTLDKAIVEVGNEPFTRLVFSRLTESLGVLGSDGITEIVCYGLGRFSQSRSSRYQLALLLCLKARYEPARVHVYDPVFRPEEVRALRTRGLEVAETNEEGKHTIQRDSTTLVYMPHCSRQLTNNFLYANWGDGLRDCILLANSFTNTVDDCLRRDISNTAGYILRIRPYVTEIQLKNSFVHEEVFNDLNIHIFTRQDLLKAPSDFWNAKEEPRYLKKDAEFVTAAHSDE